MAYKDVLEQSHALAAQGRFSEAIALQARFIDQAQQGTRPVDGVIWHNYASLLGDAGRHDEAVTACQSAFKAGLDAPETWLVFARSLQGIGEFERAEDAFRATLAKRPGDGAAHRDLAQLIWMLTGNLDEALGPLDKALAQTPDDAGLLVLRAQILGYCGDSKGEFSALQKTAQNHADPDLFLTLLAEAAIKAQVYDQGIEFVHRAITRAGVNPTLAEIHVRGLLATGEPQPALAQIVKLRAHEPNNQYYRALEATALRLAGDDRYHQLYDYENLVQAMPLDSPNGWSSLKAYSDDLQGALDERHPFTAHPFGLSVRHGSQVASIETIDNPALKAYPYAVARLLETYCETVRVRTGKTSPLGPLENVSAPLLAAWSVRLPPNGFHVDHVHPQGWLSSACHLRKVDNRAEADHRAGWIKFGEPGIVTDPPLGAEHFIEPQAGTMVIFPSFMWHGTVPFTSDASRLTIAADFRKQSSAS